MNIAFHCKICKKPGIAQVDDSCPLSWVDKLSPMLCHNKCADDRAQYVSSCEAIFECCTTLQRIPMLGIDGAEENMKREAIRRALIVATQNYTKVVARIKNMAREVWDMDFVAQLMEHPVNATKIISEYRRGLNRIISAQPEIRATHPDA